MEIFQGIKKRIENISEFMNLNEKEINLLLQHKKINHAVLNVDGEEYDAWRIIHNNALGPGKGGIRFHPEVSEDEVKSLSFWMSLKNSLTGLPYGGAKGGVKVNPKLLDKKQIEKISRKYIQAFHENLGQDKDIPAPDVYTNSEIMSWMLDEFEKINKKHEPGMITGKPIELGGIVLRADSTSKGGVIVLKELMKKINKKPEETTIAIQGFGNAGMNIASMLDNEGFKIISVSDSKGGIITKEKLNIKEVIEIKNQKNSVTEYPENKISNQELLEIETDILILAALENQITKENAKNIKAKYILELANGPITEEADKILLNKKIIVIPDILANSGGVVVSYFEWLQNKIGNILEEEFLKDKFNKIMIQAFDKVYNLYQENNQTLDMRSAAYVIAIKRILKAEKSRGNLE